MRHDATLPDQMPSEHRHSFLRYTIEAALLAGLFVAMAVCLAAGPRIVALLLQ